MRNTVMLPGTHSPESILKTISKGIFLEEYVDGCTNYDGTFTVKAKNAFLIENGEFSAVIENIELGSTIVNFMNSIAMIGSDLGWSHNSWCQKENFRVPVSCAVPTIKCELEII